MSNYAPASRRTKLDKIKRENEKKEITYTSIESNSVSEEGNFKNHLLHSDIKCSIEMVLSIVMPTITHMSSVFRKLDKSSIDSSIQELNDELDKAKTKIKEEITEGIKKKIIRAASENNNEIESTVTGISKHIGSYTDLLNIPWTLSISKDIQQAKKIVENNLDQNKSVNDIISQLKRDGLFDTVAPKIAFELLAGDSQYMCPVSPKTNTNILYFGDVIKPLFIPIIAGSDTVANTLFNHYNYTITELLKSSFELAGGDSVANKVNTKISAVDSIIANNLSIPNKIESYDLSNVSLTKITSDYGMILSTPFKIKEINGEKYLADINVDDNQIKSNALSIEDSIELLNSTNSINQFSEPNSSVILTGLENNKVYKNNIKDIDLSEINKTIDQIDYNKTSSVILGNTRLFKKKSQIGNTTTNELKGLSNKKISDLVQNVRWMDSVSSLVNKLGNDNITDASLHDRLTSITILRNGKDMDGTVIHSVSDPDKAMKLLESINMLYIKKPPIAELTVGLQYIPLISDNIDDTNNAIVLNSLDKHIRKYGFGSYNDKNEHIFPASQILINTLEISGKLSEICEVEGKKISPAKELFKGLSNTIKDITSTVDDMLTYVKAHALSEVANADNLSLIDTLSVGTPIRAENYYSTFNGISGDSAEYSTYSGRALLYITEDIDSIKDISIHIGKEIDFEKTREDDIIQYKNITKIENISLISTTHIVTDRQIGEEINLSSNNNAVSFNYNLGSDYLKGMITESELYDKDNYSNIIDILFSLSSSYSDIDKEAIEVKTGSTDDDTSVSVHYKTLVKIILDLWLGIVDYENTEIGFIYNDQNKLSNINVDRIGVLPSLLLSLKNTYVFEQVLLKDMYNNKNNLGTIAWFDTAQLSTDKYYDVGTLNPWIDNVSVSSFFPAYNKVLESNSKLRDYFVPIDSTNVKDIDAFRRKNFMGEIIHVLQLSLSHSYLQKYPGSDIINVNDIMDYDGLLPETQAEVLSDIIKVFEDNNISTLNNILPNIIIDNPDQTRPFYKEIYDNLPQAYTDYYVSSYLFDSLISKTNNVNTNKLLVLFELEKDNTGHIEADFYCTIKEFVKKTISDRTLIIDQNTSNEFENITNNYVVMKAALLYLTEHLRLTHITLEEVITYGLLLILQTEDTTNRAIKTHISKYYPLYEILHSTKEFSYDTISLKEFAIELKLINNHLSDSNFKPGNNLDIKKITTLFSTITKPEGYTAFNIPIQLVERVSNTEDDTLTTEFKSMYKRLDMDLIGNEIIDGMIEEKYVMLVKKLSSDIFTNDDIFTESYFAIENVGVINTLSQYSAFLYYITNKLYENISGILNKQWADTEDNKVYRKKTLLSKALVSKDSYYNGKKGERQLAIELGWLGSFIKIYKDTADSTIPYKKEVLYPLFLKEIDSTKNVPIAETVSGFTLELEDEFEKEQSILRNILIRPGYLYTSLLNNIGYRIYIENGEEQLVDNMTYSRLSMPGIYKDNMPAFLIDGKIDSKLKDNLNKAGEWTRASLAENDLVNAENINQLGFKPTNDYTSYMDKSNAIKIGKGTIVFDIKYGGLSTRPVSVKHINVKIPGTPIPDIGIKPDLKNIILKYISYAPTTMNIYKNYDEEQLVKLSTDIPKITNEILEKGYGLSTDDNLSSFYKIAISVIPKTISTDEISDLCKLSDKDSIIAKIKDYIQTEKLIDITYSDYPRICSSGTTEPTFTNNVPTYPYIPSITVINRTLSNGTISDFLFKDLDYAGFVNESLADTNPLSFIASTSQVGLSRRRAVGNALTIFKRLLDNSTWIPIPGSINPYSGIYIKSGVVLKDFIPSRSYNNNFNKIEVIVVPDYNTDGINAGIKQLLNITTDTITNDTIIDIAGTSPLFSVPANSVDNNSINLYPVDSYAVNSASTEDMINDMSTRYDYINYKTYLDYIKNVWIYAEKADSIEKTIAILNGEYFKKSGETELLSITDYSNLCFKRSITTPLSINNLFIENLKWTGDNPYKEIFDINNLYKVVSGDINSAQEIWFSPMYIYMLIAILNHSRSTQETKKQLKILIEELLGNTDTIYPSYVQETSLFARMLLNIDFIYLNAQVRIQGGVASIPKINNSTKFIKSDIVQGSYGYTKNYGCIVTKASTGMEYIVPTSRFGLINKNNIDEKIELSPYLGKIIKEEGGSNNHIDKHIGLYNTPIEANEDVMTTGINPVVLWRYLLLSEYAKLYDDKSTKVNIRDLFFIENNEVAKKLSDARMQNSNNSKTTYTFAEIGLDGGTQILNKTTQYTGGASAYNKNTGPGGFSRDIKNSYDPMELDLKTNTNFINTRSLDILYSLFSFKLFMGVDELGVEIELPEDSISITGLTKPEHNPIDIATSHNLFQSMYKGIVEEDYVLSSKLRDYLSDQEKENINILHNTMTSMIVDHLIYSKDRNQFYKIVDLNKDFYIDEQEVIGEALGTSYINSTDMTFEYTVNSIEDNKPITTTIKTEVTNVINGTDTNVVLSIIGDFKIV